MPYTAAISNSWALSKFSWNVLDGAGWLVGWLVACLLARLVRWVGRQIRKLVVTQSNDKINYRVAFLCDDDSAASTSRKDCHIHTTITRI